MTFLYGLTQSTFILQFDGKVSNILHTTLMMDEEKAVVKNAFHRNLEVLRRDRQATKRKIRLDSSL